VREQGPDAAQRDQVPPRLGAAGRGDIVDGDPGQRARLDGEEVALVPTCREVAHPALGVDVPADREECQSQIASGTLGSLVVPGTGLEPARCNASGDFKSPASTSSATPAPRPSPPCERNQ